jgi:putative peptide zinc metalloprotease protein
VGAAFHEMGHAAACRYGGGTPGKMGCGLYLAWPAFYTDVTDAYRLGRAARLRTDLGGIYFNIVIVVATVGAYLLTGFEPLLLLVVVQHFEIAHQLLPVVRLDGYYIVADLTGVPDLFARIGPILRSVLPWRATEPEVSALKRWVRVAVTLWVLIVVPLLLFELLVVLVHLPRILATGWASGSGLWDTAQGAFADGRALEGIAGVLQIIVLTLPIVGILLVLFKTATGLAGGVWRFTQGRPVVRTLAVAIGGIGVAALAMAWIPRTNYAPIRPGERGTITETARAVTQLPTRAPVLANEAKAGTATTPSTTTTLPPDATSTTVESSTTSSTDFTTTTSVSGGGSPTTNRSTTSTTAADTTTTPTTAASPTTTAAP